MLSLLSGVNILNSVWLQVVKSDRNCFCVLTVQFVRECYCLLRNRDDVSVMSVKLMGDHLFV